MSDLHQNKVVSAFASGFHDFALTFPAQVLGYLFGLVCGPKWYPFAALVEVLPQLNFGLKISLKIALRIPYNQLAQIGSVIGLNLVAGVFH